jgi:hypothetical protein
MSDVQEQLENVMDKWCGSEAGTYGAGTLLRDMWEQAYPTTPAYDPQGINNLINQVHKNSFFKNYDKAKELEYGHFVGGIKTYGNLYDFLES